MLLTAAVACPWLRRLLGEGDGEDRAAGAPARPAPRRCPASRGRARGDRACRRRSGRRRCRGRARRSRSARSLRRSSSCTAGPPPEPVGALARAAGRCWRRARRSRRRSRPSRTGTPRPARGRARSRSSRRVRFADLDRPVERLVAALGEVGRDQNLLRCSRFHAERIAIVAPARRPASCGDGGPDAGYARPAQARKKCANLSARARVGRGGGEFAALILPCVRVRASSRRPILQRQPRHEPAQPIVRPGLAPR